MSIGATQEAYTTVRSGTASGMAASGGVQEMSDRFMKLLVTQLKNQDPMNPMENAELTMQLAQMSTVEGVNRLNDGLAALDAWFRASQVLQGAGLVGRQVLAQGDVLRLSGSTAVGGLVLDNVADSVRVDIHDAAGNLVKSLDLGGQDAGLVRFVWDGTNAGGIAQADGVYTFQARAMAAGEDVTSTGYALGQVLSVALNDGAMEVEVAGLGNLALSQIRQIF
ncbi:MAG TPA: flagellar hook assembly protein FlgD [Thiobacillaceae bacterium]|nr:flagellar hook assembly protein FlgD [Thiobacillaceae bacterium]HNU62973.1 flagellar hook assembly protein FlgD [Thiobacillaceae bacterium]